MVAVVDWPFDLWMSCTSSSNLPPRLSYLHSPDPRFTCCTAQPKSTLILHNFNHPSHTSSFVIVCLLISTLLNANLGQCTRSVLSHYTHVLMSSFKQCWHCLPISISLPSLHSSVASQSTNYDITMRLWCSVANEAFEDSNGRGRNVKT